MSGTVKVMDVEATVHPRSVFLLLIFFPFLGRKARKQGSLVFLGILSSVWSEGFHTSVTDTCCLYTVSPSKK